MSRQRSLEKITLSEYITIGELVRLSGMRYSTLKYYTEEGLLLFEQKEENLTRHYHRENTLKTIKTIEELKKDKIPVNKIKEHLTLVNSQKQQ